MGKGKNGCDGDMAMSAALSEKDSSVYEAVDTAEEEPRTYVAPSEDDPGDFPPEWADPSMKLLDEDKDTQEERGRRARDKARSKQVQRDSMEEAVRKQKEIDEAGSLEEAIDKLRQFDESRKLPSLISYDEKVELLAEFDKRAEGPAERAIREREDWPEHMRLMARDMQLDAPAFTSSDRTPSPIVPLFQSRDFQEVTKNCLVNFTARKLKTATGTDAEDMVMDSVAALGFTVPNPEEVVSFYWKNPDEGGKLYFIQLYPRGSEVDPFDIVVDIEEVGEDEEGNLTFTQADQRRVSVKAPKGDPREFDSYEAIGEQTGPSKQVIDIDFHNVNTSEVENPEKFLERVSQTMLGGGDTLWGGTFEDQKDGITEVSYGALRLVDPSVRRGYVMAKQLGIKPVFVLDKKSLKGDQPRGRYEWIVPCVNEDGSIPCLKKDGTIDYEAGGWTKLVFPVYYAAVKSGQRPAEHGGQRAILGKPARRSGKPVLTGDGLKAPGKLKIGRRGSSKLARMLVPPVLRYRSTWHRQSKRKRSE